MSEPRIKPIVLTTDVSGILPLTNGGTNSTTFSGARTNLGIVTKYKASATSRNTTVTPTIDPDLQFAVAANEVWEFEFLGFVSNSGAAPGFRHGLGGPASPTSINWKAFMETNGAQNVASTGITTSFQTNWQVGNPGAVDLLVVTRGTLINGANAGTVGLYWAQETSDAANTILMAGSRLVATRMA